MKRIKVTITTILELSDEFSVITSPSEGNDPGQLCLHRGDEHYAPTLAWLGREKSLSSEAGAPPNISWSSVGDDVGNELLEATCSEDCDIQELGPNS